MQQDIISSNELCKWFPYCQYWRHPEPESVRHTELLMHQDIISSNELCKWFPYCQYWRHPEPETVRQKEYSATKHYLPDNLNKQHPDHESVRPLNYWCSRILLAATSFVNGFGIANIDDIQNPNQSDILNYWCNRILLAATSFVNGFRIANIGDIQNLNQSDKRIFSNKTLFAGQPE